MSKRQPVTHTLDDDQWLVLSVMTKEHNEALKMTRNVFARKNYKIGKKIEHLTLIKIKGMLKPQIYQPTSDHMF